MDLTIEDWVVALPGVLIVAAISFPALYFPRWHFVYRLVLAWLSVLGVGYLFGLLMAHKVYIMRPEDLAIEAVGIGLSCLISVLCRVIRPGTRV